MKEEAPAALSTKRLPWPLSGSSREPRGTVQRLAYIQRLAGDELARVGHHGPVSAMGVRLDSLPRWDDAQTLTAQFARTPLLDEAPVTIELVIGPRARKPLRHVLLNNHELGKISKEQRPGNWDVWETSLTNPNFADYASLYGAFGARVTRREELSGSLEEARRYDGPTLVEIFTDPLLV